MMILLVNAMFIAEADIAWNIILRHSNIIDQDGVRRDHVQEAGVKKLNVWTAWYPHKKSRV
eukprot:5852885-Karenia_brevis.AAC.1